jgi:hypothetical protein
MTESPYLINRNRLSDVIAAIQVMGTYRVYKLDFENWSEKLSGIKTKDEYWKNVFKEHPEFFRLDELENKASLVWRRQYPRRFNIDTELKITREEYYELTEDQKKRISRNPLEPETIQSLITTAIEISSQALELKQDKRWWIPVIVGGVSGLIGALLGSLYN